MSTRLSRRIVAKTTNYTIVATVDRAGTAFTNVGATAPVTFTLPTPADAILGTWYQFLGVADQNIIVATPVADTLIALNDVAADSIAMQTAGQKIGGQIEAVCVKTAAGYAWLAIGNAVGVTYTVAT